MKHTAFLALLIVAIPMLAHAKRMVYDTEIIDEDSLVAIWTEAEIKGQSLGSPKKVLNGDPAAALELKAGQTKDVVARLEKGEELILVVNRYRIGKKIAHVSRIWESTEANLKMLDDLFRHKAEIKNWNRYSKETQIERAHLVVRGQVEDAGISVPTHTVLVKSTLKGDHQKSLGVYARTTPDDQLKTDCLMLVQRMPGSGPGYRIMTMVPCADAEGYLEYITRGDK